MSQKLKNPQSILVVGGAGFVGSHVSKLLFKNGFKPVVLDNLSTGRKDFAKFGPFYEGSYGNESLVQEILEKHQVQTVMHFGAKALVGESMHDPLMYYESNVSESISLLKAMERTGTSEIVFSSTCSTFGIPKTVPIHESLPQSPVNPYGSSKLMIEKILKDLSHLKNLKCAILRYFNASGCDPEGELGECHEPETHLIPKAIRVLLGIDPELHLFGNDYPTKDGSCVRDYIHVNDLGQGHLLAMNYLREKKESNDFNLGTEKGYSVFEVIEAISKVSGMKLNYQIGPRRPGDPPVLIADSRKAKNTLGWTPEHSLEEIVKHTLHWMKKVYGK